MKKPRGKRSEETGRRTAMGMRVAPYMRDMLVASAQESGRSLTQEIELRLEHSYRHPGPLKDSLEAAFGADGAELLMVIGRLIRHAPAVCGLGIEDRWRDDATAYSVAEREISHMLALMRPPGEPRPLVGESSENRAARLLVALKLIEPPAEWAEEDAQ
jgi:hypothetical protein